MGRASDRRIARVRSLLLRTLADIVRDELDDPRVELVSFCDLELSRDLSYADVKVAAAGGQEASEKCAAALNSAAPLLWNRLRNTTDLRTVPKLRFHVDHGLEYIDEIERLLKENPRPAGIDDEPAAGEPAQPSKENTD